MNVITELLSNNNDNNCWNVILTLHHLSLHECYNYKLLL